MLWYFSFADGSRPKGSQFLGVAVVEAPDEVSAARETWRQGCNPGGGVVFVEIPEDFQIPPEAVNKLLSEAEVEKFFGPVEHVEGPG